MFIAGKGKWVMFNLPEEQARLAEANGAWKTRTNKFCGVVGGESYTPEGIMTHPSRIMLVSEAGANIPTIHDGQIVNMAVIPAYSDLAEPPAGENWQPIRQFGIVAIAQDLEPVDDRLDMPPGRRSDIHPRDLRKRQQVSVATSAEEGLRQKIAELEAKLAEKDQT